MSSAPGRDDRSFSQAQKKEYRMVHIRKGSPVPSSLRARAQRAINVHGHMAVHRSTQLSESCFWRAMGGGPVHASTAVMLERGLDSLTADAGVPLV